MDIIEQALAFVKEFFSKEFSGHDYFHTLRVYKMATHIALKEGADLQTVQLAALLHDVDDRKLSPQTHATKANARSFLRDHRVTEDTVEIICRIIEEISFGADAAPSTLESQCVQDADRLDAIGAVGIGRAFAFGGSRGRLMHDPKIQPKLNMTAEEYRSFTKAAEMLHYSQSGISRMIADLEKEWGMALLERGKNGVKPMWGACSAR